MEIKLTLFNHCYHAKNIYLKYKNQELDYEVSDHVIDKAFGEFCGLYHLIEDLGLEDEYEEWKQYHLEGE